MIVRPEDEASVQGSGAITALDAVVAHLLQARDGGNVVPAAFVATNPLSISDGFAVQMRIQAAAGAVAGWKISGSSTPDKPNFAPIFARNMHGSLARFAPSTFHDMSIECEIAYRMGCDLVSPPYSRDEVADAIEALVPLVEVCDSRLADFKNAPQGWRLADCGRNGAMLIGTSFADWRSVDTQKQAVSLTFDGTIVARSSGNPKPDLVAVVQLLANQVGMHCGGVRAGQIIATGSMTGTLGVPPGTMAVAKFQTLGEIHVIFEK